jgi:hypothetical protein
MTSTRRLDLVESRTSTKRRDKILNTIILVAETYRARAILHLVFFHPCPSAMLTSRPYYCQSLFGGLVTF